MQARSCAHKVTPILLCRLCQAEISKKMLNCNKVVTALLEVTVTPSYRPFNMHTLLSQNETGETSAGQTSLEYLSTMPLADDDAISEYRSQANSFVYQLTT